MEKIYIEILDLRQGKAPFKHLTRDPIEILQRLKQTSMFNNQHRCLKPKLGDYSQDDPTIR